MVYESNYAAYKGPLYRWTFNNEQSILKDWTNTAVTFSQGIGTFNGSSSYLTNKIRIPNGTYTLRIKINPTNFTGQKMLLDFRGSNEDGTGYLTLSATTGQITYSAGTTYVNGVASVTTVLNVNNDIFQSGVSIINGTGTSFNTIGVRCTLASLFYTGTIDLVEIYPGTLTATDVANLYTNRTNKHLNPGSVVPILDVNAFGGVIKNTANTTAITNTATSVVKDGDIYAMQFNGTTSALDCGAYNTLVGDITICAWVKSLRFGGGDAGVILHNDYLFLRNTLSSSLYSATSNNSTVVSSAGSSVTLGVYKLIIITRSATGVLNFYVNGVANGTANQASGTPTAGTNIFIGNRAAGSRTFDGCIGRVQVYSGLLTTAEIMQKFTSERKLYGV